MADVSFGYGNPGDVGVVGDWNASGRDSVGIKRGAWWYLFNTAGKPFADIVASYGEPWDVPVTGHWLPHRRHHRHRPSHLLTDFCFGRPGVVPMTGRVVRPIVRAMTRTTVPGPYHLLVAAPLSR